MERNTHRFVQSFNIFLLLALLIFTSTTANSKNLSITQGNIRTFVKIQAHFDEQEFEEAHKLIVNLEKKNDLNNLEKTYLHNFKGTIEFRNKNYEKALKEFTKIANNPEGVPEVFINSIKRVIFDLNKTIATESLSKSKSESKILDLKAQLNNNLSKKDRADIYANIARNYYNLDDHVKATDYYTRVFNLGNEEIPPIQYLEPLDLLRYSEYLDKNGEKLKALTILEGVYKKEPLLLDKHYKLLGQLYFDNEQFLNAAEFYEDAINQNLIFEDSETSHFLLKSLLYAEQKEKALNYANKFQEKINDSELLMTISEVYFKFEEWGKTESVNKKLLKISKNTPHNALHWYQIGVARYHLDNLRGAKKALKKSLKNVSEQDEWQNEANQLLEKINNEQKKSK